MNYPKKIDKRISYKIVLDTETCPIIPSSEVNPFNMLCYNVGWAVVDKRGKIYAVRSFANSDIFLRDTEKLKSAYYYDKMPFYVKAIKNREMVLTPFENIRKAFLNDIEFFNSKQVFAHNMYFDYHALNTTMQYLTRNRKAYFFSYGLKICDTLRMSRDILGNMPTYKRFCIENNYLTKDGNCRFTAEILYRFISKDYNFIEKHTAIEDVLIEKEILSYCYRQHKKMNILLKG